MRSYLFASLASLSAAAVLVLACGGSKPPEAPAPATGSAAATASAAPATAPSTTTTTTMTLGDGGDVTGVKLATSSTTVVPTTESRVDAGVNRGPEPGRSVRDIQAIVLARRDAARACYDDELKANPGIEGNVDITWVIDPKGDATEVGFDATTSTIHDDKVWKCIAAIIQKIKFAPSAKGFQTKTHYPFNFHPKTMVGGAHDAGTH